WPTALNRTGNGAEGANMPKVAWKRGSLFLAALVVGGASVAPAAEALSSGSSTAPSPSGTSGTSGASGASGVTPSPSPLPAPVALPATRPAVYVAPAGSAQPLVSASALDTIRSDADWVMQSRLPDGAIASY